MFGGSLALRSHRSFAFFLSWPVIPSLVLFSSDLCVLGALPCEDHPRFPRRGLTVEAQQVVRSEG